jgi:FAD-dependent oxidoreductase domain-containing protein 1
MEDSVETADVLIIGGGVVGSSIAYNLLSDGFKGRVIVFEKDPSYEFASTPLAAGGVRQQFANPTNIRMMQYSVPFYENFDKIMAVEGEPAHAEFRQRGYMYLADESNWERYNTNYETQKRLGADVVILTPRQILECFNEINLGINLDGLKGAFLGPRDGRLDPYSVLQGFIKKAKSLGAKYVYDEVTGFTIKNHRIIKLTTKKGEAFSGPVVVNAAGAWAQEVGKLADIYLPVLPTNHQNYLCLITKKFRDRLPMTVFPNRIWFMGESESKILTGLTKLDQKPGFIFDWDRDHFMDNVWPKLAERIPLFETLKLERGYAGLYEITPDECCILGEHPELKGFYLANGFSGHGVMQAPTTGKLISELIRLGRYETLDATEFSIDRFEKGKSIISEKMH